MNNDAVILHLSDIQFGAHHRFSGCGNHEDSDAFLNPRYGDNNSFQTLSAKIDDDLKILFEERNLRPNILVISGDLAEWSLEDEYNNVEAFICSIIHSQHTDIDLSRVILVPGNHDVNWSLSESYFLECTAHRKRPEPPYEKKYLFWKQFLDRVGVKKTEPNIPWQGFDISEQGILVVALDSCVQESHRKEDHYGWIGIKQIKEATKWLEELDPSHSYFRIAVFHHNPVRYSDYDDENLKDWDELRPHFEKSIDIILHGHRHENYRSIIGNLDGQEVLIFGSGSAGLDQEAMPSNPNQYQIISLSGNQGCLYLRSYSEQTIGDSGKGHFRPDMNQKGKWEYPFTINSITPPKAYSESKSTAPGQFAIDEYVNLAVSDISQRLLREQEKVGDIIGLKCINIETKIKYDIDVIFQEWLESNQNRMAILGSAGSGKTISCLNLCRSVSQNTDSKWIPLYIDLGRFVALDDILEILADCFRNQGMIISKQQALNIIETKNLLIFLDAFDEYEKGGIISASDRSFQGFQHLNRSNVKIVLTCRSNFFRCPEDIFIYELRTHDFDLCPANSMVLELLPLEPIVISSTLSPYIANESLPEWLFELTDRPLHLRMIVPLVKMKAVDLSQSLRRHELYEKFLIYVLNWDIIRRSPARVTLDQSRSFHVLLAERFLDRGSASLADVELIHLIEKTFDCKRTDDRFVELLFFFQQSALLRFDGGRIIFSHKSYREYLVAKSIYNLVVIEDDTFQFTWFTRNERDFILEMLEEPEINTLCRWLSSEDKYPACNYASFILGGTGNTRLISHLTERLQKTRDPLIKVNCANALAALGDVDVKGDLLGMVSGYLLDEGVLTIPPSGCSQEAIQWPSNLQKKFSKSVMIIHLCETIDALAMVGDAACVDTLKLIEKASDKSVADEAKGAIRRLLNRLSNTKNDEDFADGRRHKLS